MNRVITVAVTGFVATGLASFGCESDKSTKNTTHAAHASDAKMAMHADMKTAKAEVGPSKAPGMDNVKGTVKFMQEANSVKVSYNLSGLTPNGTHGFHIHEKGDLSDPELKSAGGHFNPGGGKHGSSEGNMRHGGDLGNITADADGKAKGVVNVMGITVDDTATGVLGRSVIVHEKADDLKTDPAGSSGPRIAGGVINATGTKAPAGEKDSK